MKSKMSKKLIAFILCMVLVICNSVSILADTPAPETATVEKQVKETKTANDKKASDDEAGDTENVSPQSEESAPEVKTTEKKEETTEATTQKKDEADEVTTKAKEETEKADETTTEAKETTKKEETTETQEEKTTKAKEETSETSGEKNTEKTTEAEEKTAESAEKTEEKEFLPTELTYDDANVKIVVSADKENVIPAGVTLKVTPVINDGNTAEQYAQVEQQLEEQKLEKNTTVAGFLAYDISLITKEGNEIEPNGEVKVDIDYKEASIADIKQGIVEADSDIDQNKDWDVTVLHLEENQDGTVKEVVDLSEQNKIETLETTEEQKVQKISFNTSSFSIYCVTWQDYDGKYEVEVGEQIKLNSTGSGIWPSWSSSDNKTAGVNGEGNQAIVTGNKQGEVTITYTYWTWNRWNYKYETHTETCTVIVKDSGGSGSQGGSGTVVTEKELSHEKYILYNSEDDTYDLTLNVSGAVGTETQKAPMDILFIMDTSNSMQWSMFDSGEDQDTFLGDYQTNSESRFYNQQKAVEDAVEAIEAKGTIDARYAVVAFDTLAGKVQNWTANPNISYPSQVGNYPEDGLFGWEAGGTNYEAALEEAEDLLKNARPEADTVVVFLSDGDVTLYNGYNGVSGNGGSYDAEGMSQAKTALGRLNVNYFYTVGVGPSDSYTHLRKLREGAPHGATVGYFEGETADDLSSAFDNIIAEVTDLLCTDVTITDTLSGYVEPVDKNEELKVIVKDENGDLVLTPSGIEAEYVQKNGKTQIVVTFPEDYQLESGYTYFVTAKIKATDFAYQQYEQNGGNYGNMRGDEYTDENTNPNTPGYTSNSGTSSNQPGFYANDDAIVEYVYNGEKNTEHYKKPVIQISEDKLQNLEPVNFYLNLSSKILDTDGSITGQENGDFTTSVSGDQSGETEGGQGIGVPINEDLKVVVPKEHVNHEEVEDGWVYGVIGGESELNAKQVDEYIRKLGTEEGAYGNQDGTEYEWYQIVDGNGNPAFPTDEKIFKYIRDNWTKGVSKEKDIKVNEEPIDVDNLTTENFAIRWYVFKDQKADCWHIDGILVPKSGLLNITKTFSNKEVADQLTGTFAIEVKGNFLGNGDSTKTLTLEQASVTGGTTENEPVTYTWTSLAVFGDSGDSYEVKETGYQNGLTDWKYESTNYTYTKNEVVEDSGSRSEVIIKTDRTGNDEEPIVQTLAFTNNYSLKATNLDLKKTSKNGEYITGAEFKLSQKQESGEWQVIKETIEVSNDETVELTNLVTGEIYKLEEIQAPEAHMLLGEPIYFTVEDGTVKLCNEEGVTSSGASTDEMWSLNEEGNVLTIKNNILYDLPEAGGSGIYWYTVSGALLMMGAALIVYREKRKREVLLRK